MAVRIRSLLPCAEEVSAADIHVKSPSQVRVVRLVADIAQRAAGVFGGDHLREVLRLGCVFFVAAAAQVGDVGQVGLSASGVVGVRG